MLTAYEDRTLIRKDSAVARELGIFSAIEVDGKVYFVSDFLRVRVAKKSGNKRVERCAPEEARLVIGTGPYSRECRVLIQYVEPLGIAFSDELVHQERKNYASRYGTVYSLPKQERLHVIDVIESSEVVEGGV